MRPPLRKFGHLTKEDFAAHPVWVACHSTDYEEPWYDDTDEETFRPRTGPTPVDLASELLLVRAVAALANGTILPGFLTPSASSADLATLQPHLFADGRAFAFWGGAIGIGENVRDAIYAALGLTADEVFPIHFTADTALANSFCEITVPGWGDQATNTAAAVAIPPRYPDEELLTVPEAARKAGITNADIVRLIFEGELANVPRRGQIAVPRSELEAWLDRQGRSAGR